MEKPTVFVVSCHDYRELKTDILAVRTTYGGAVERLQEEVNSVYSDEFRVIDNGSEALFFPENYTIEDYPTEESIYNAGGSREYHVFITAMPLEG